MNFNELTLFCRTYRRFQQKEIPDEILTELAENLRTVNSAMNGQVLRYLLVKDKGTVKEMQPYIHWAGALPKELGTPKEGETPVAFLLLCKDKKANPWADIDAGIAMRNVALNAAAHGIGSAMLGAVEWNKITDILSVPEDWTPRLLLALGYPSCESRLVDVPEDGNLKYYLDENKNYCVPKRPLKDILIVK